MTDISGEDVDKAIVTLATIYEFCKRDCIPEGEPCRYMEQGDCIVQRAYLLKVQLGL